MGKKKKAPAKTFADEIDPIIADALPELPEGVRTAGGPVTAKDCVDIIEMTATMEPDTPPLSVVEYAISGDKSTPRLNADELKYQDELPQEDPRIYATNLPTQPVSVKCRNCGESRVYELNQLPSTTDGVFVAGGLLCAGCLGPAAIKIEGPVL